MIVPILGLAVFSTAIFAAQQAPAPTPMARFAGTWVGTQSWAIENPPPGSRNDQPVTLIIDVTDGKLTGSMKPFLGGDDGATIVDAKIVGEELHATASVGRPRQAGRRGAPPRPDAGNGADTGNAPAQPGPTGNWKNSVAVSFAFRNDGLNLTGAADVRLGDVPWMKFKYELSRKRSRY
jgi:hypothetical protein